MVSSEASFSTSKQPRLPCRILSIQSHVVRGYVGNKAAVFPLQLLGHHVDFINSVQFTSMYIHEGEKLEGNLLRRLLETLPLVQKTPGLEDHPGQLKSESLIESSLPIDHRYLLTGYVGTASFMKEIVNFVANQKKIRQKNPNVHQFEWLCDPVMGDNGKPYVASDVIAIYKTQVIPLADILTPNQYELEWLCDRSVTKLEDAIQCCRLLHARGPKIIIVTSMAFSQKETNELTLLASEKRGDEKYHQFIIRFPRLDVFLGGTGDLMAAMLLDGLDKHDNRLELACERAVAILQVCPQQKHDLELLTSIELYACHQLPNERDVMRKTVSHETKWHEVDVIGGANEIMNPNLRFHAEPPP